MRDMVEVLNIQDAWSEDQITQFYAEGRWQAVAPATFLELWAAEAPDRVFVYDGDARLTRRHLLERSTAVAHGLAQRGVGRGQRVAVQLPNWHEFVIIQLALLQLGAVLVPIMPVYRDHEVEHVLRNTEAVAYAYTPSFRGFDYRSMADRLAAELPELRWRIAVRSGVHGPDGELALDRLGDVATSPGVPLDSAPVDDPHFIVFTSGTESKSKGCVHTWNTYAFTPRVQLTLYGFDTTSIELVVSPVTHTTGLASGLLKPLLGGGSICLMDVWDPDAAVELIEQFGCTHITGATPFLTMLLDAITRRGGGGASLKVFVCGGAPVPAAVVRTAKQVMPDCQVLTAYGQSEVLLVTAVARDDDEDHVIGSDGRPIPGVELRLVDSNGHECEPGAEGEICYRSPGQMLGYWRDPDATAAVSRADGWRRSGDVGRLDGEGYLRVTGRTKDIIIRGGMNISAREVEELLVGHPSVAAAAVTGVPDEALGERVGAVLVAAPGASIDQPRLLRYLSESCRVAKQKLPERMVVVDTLPTNATGKVVKYELRRMLTSSTEAD